MEGERPGRPSKLSIDQLRELEVILRASPREQGISANLWDGKTLSHWIRQQWGVNLGTRQCQRLFRTLGFRLRKPRPMVGHADPELQKTHKKLLALAREQSVDLWALDEVHFQQHGSRCRMWVPPELKDPILLHAPTRKSVSYFGAVCLRDGKYFVRRNQIG